MKETIPTNTLSSKQELVTNPLLTRKELVQFKKLVYSEYGVTLTDKQAYIHAMALFLILGTLLEIYFAFRCLIGSNTQGDRKR